MGRTRPTDLSADRQVFRARNIHYEIAERNEEWGKCDEDAGEGFESNWAYMVMAALAWNLKAWGGLVC